MLAAATTATQATTAANTASIAAPTANNRSNNNNSSIMQMKKVVLYNPSIDYSAPLQQQINPDIIGAHPHAQQYQQQCGAGSSASGASNVIHNTNQVRQPQQQQQQAQQQQAQQQPRAPTFTPVAAARMSLAGLAAAATTTAAAAQTSTQQQQQQQKQQLAHQQQMLATLPLKLSEQCNLSNLHLNSFVSEISPIKSGLEQPQLQQQQQQQQRSINQVVGLLGRNGESSALLANCSVGSSISNLLISNNLATTTATPAASTTATGAFSRETAGDAATTSVPTANKLNALWSQPHAAVSSFMSGGGCNTAAGQPFGNQTSTTDAISTLWGCTPSSVSSGASSTSGCSSGSGSQPSLSPTSSTSTRPNYRSSNSKEPLWSVSQSSPNTNNSLRDTYYTTKTGVAINAASSTQAGGTDGGVAGVHTAGDKNQQSTSPSASSTCSSASSTCSSGLGSSSSTGIDVGVWPNCKLQSYFAADNCVATAASIDDTSQFAKISNIWDIPNPAADNTARATTDLFTDLWRTNTNDRNSNAAEAAASRMTSNINADMDVGECIDFTDASSIWRTNVQPSTVAGGAGSRALTKQLPTTAAPGGSNNKGFLSNPTTDGDHCMGAGRGVVEADGGTACMQLFSEQFLNYINIMNYAD